MSSKRKTFECFLKLMSVKSCHQDCICASRIRQLIAYIPINNSDKLKNELLLSDFEKKYHICYDNFCQKCKKNNI